MGRILCQKLLQARDSLIFVMKEYVKLEFKVNMFQGHEDSLTIFQMWGTFPLMKMKKENMNLFFT